MASSMHLIVRDAPVILAPPEMGPYTTPSLTANMVLRVFLGLLANTACIVPLRLLYKNNEFAAVVFIVNVMVKTFETILHALIWRNNDLESWWPGYGLCDANPYVHNFSLGLFVTSLLAIMQNIARQVGLLRVNPLSVKEKRKRNLVQALILFPLPLLQLALTWPLTAQRYAVATLIGCAWVSYPTWQYVVFFVVAPVLVALATAGYAVLTWVRYRQLARTTESALSSSQTASNRAQRTKRRLYLMVVAVLVPFLPVVIALMVLNLVNMGPLQPFNYGAIHRHELPFPWSTILFIPSTQLDWAVMNQGYISIIAAIPVFMFFGMTKDAVNNYRHILLFFGLGKPFPRLHQEYDPDRGRTTNGSNSSGSRSFFSRTPNMSGQIKSIASEHVGSISSSSGASSHPPQSLNFLASPDVEAGKSSRIQYLGSFQTASHAEHEDVVTEVPRRNPFLFRTPFDKPVSFTLPFFSRPVNTDKGKRPVLAEPIAMNSFHHTTVQPPWDYAAEKPQVQTRVWSEDEIGACNELPGTHKGHVHYNSDSVATEHENLGDGEQGVVVETALTRESHQKGLH